MTPEQREDARVKAQRIVNAGGTENADYTVAVGFLSLIAQVEAQATEREKMLNIIASAYQIAGKHDAPARVLDVLADPLAATDEQVDAILPYQVEARTVPQGDVREAQANAIIGFAQALAPLLDSPSVLVMANCTAERIRGLSTIPAIPGTKEGA